MTRIVRGLEFLVLWLSIGVAAAYTFIALYCLVKGQPSWDSLGFAGFFWLIALLWSQAQRPRQS